MKNSPKLDALIADLHAIEKKHMFVLDKYSDRRKGQTRFFFKLQFPDAGAGNYEVNIEDVFSVVNH